MTGPTPVGEDDLQAYFDKRLPRERQAGVEAYLATHPEVAARAEQYARAEAMLAESLRAKFEEPIPARLRVASVLARRRRRRMAALGRAAAIALFVTTGGIGGWYARGWMARADGLHVAAVNALAAFRTFSPELRHPVEVRASDEPHLIQWLSNRLQRPLTPPDLSADGLRLMGGRVVPSSGGPAALLMYDDDHGSRLTVYVQPMGIDGTDFRLVESGDVVTVTWAERHLALALTGRFAPGRMLRLAAEVRSQVSSLEQSASPVER